MIFDRLFLQYRKDDKPWFGSRWMNLHGRLFIGDPKELGLEDVDKNLLRTYYYDKVDRYTHPKDTIEFRRNNNKLTATREAERPRVAFGASMGALMMVLALGIGYALVATPIEKVSTWLEERAAEQRKVEEAAKKAKEKERVAQGIATCKTRRQEFHEITGGDESLLSTSDKKYLEECDDLILNQSYPKE